MLWAHLAGGAGVGGSGGGREKDAEARHFETKVGA
jgi:hypothetical protein